MFHLGYAQVALADAETLLTHLAREAGFPTASRYALLLDRAGSQIAAFPESSPLRPILGEHVRIKIVTPYIMIYRFRPDERAVFFLRIIHGSRDFNAGLLG